MKSAKINFQRDNTRNTHVRILQKELGRYLYKGPWHCLPWLTPNSFPIRVQTSPHLGYNRVLKYFKSKKNHINLLTYPSQVNEPSVWKVLIWLCRVLLLNIDGCFLDFNGLILHLGHGSLPWINIIVNFNLKTVPIGIESKW